MEQQSTKLIVTADDCGLSEGINNTTLDLHRQGIVTTATVMMNFAATQHALAILADTPTLCGGVHLNLTDGYPLSNVGPDTGLVLPDGRFQPRALLFPRGYFPVPAWQDAVETEMTAQIDTYIRLAGKTPEHLTTHMHFHVVPSLRKMVLNLAERYNIPWVRVFQTSSTVIPFSFWVQEPEELFHPDNLRITPDYLTSIQAWLTQEPHLLAETLGRLNGVTEIVVHPDVADDPTYPDDMNHKPEERAKERDYMLRLYEQLQEAGNVFTLADPARAS
ncbi:MAG: ChbG/HpnK family deacetylase [Chloroflexota bacterium]